MHVLSRTLLALYEIAAQASLNDFPTAALRLLHSCIDFDGATLGMGEAHAEASWKISDAHIDCRPRSILQDYAQVAGNNSITEAFLNGLAKPLQRDCWIAYRGGDLLELDSVAPQYRLHHLMLYGDAPGAGKPGRWIVLYKESAAAFAPVEEARLQYLWPHMSQAIAINRSANLERLDSARTFRAFALLSRSGTVETADPQFLSLLQREWPDQAPNRLPPSALECLMGERTYRGRCVEITMAPQYDYLACKAQAIDDNTGITPTEYTVARRFAYGLSHKEVARELGVSHHTVRTQLAHVYEKLGIHNKAALARYLIKHI